MPTETRINVPFIPQEGITSQILTAIQLANEQKNQQQQRAIQQQQVTQQGALGQAQIEEAKARAGFYGSEAQKNQIQIDQIKRAQAMLGGGQQPQGAPQAAAQPNAGPNVSQQVQMYPGSDLAREATSNPEGFSQTAQPWLPQGTPPQLAPFVSAMIPKDLNDQEKNVIEGGAQTGRLKAMQSGDLGGYLNDIRAGVDAVVTNRNKNVENQPLQPSDRENFSKNVLPSFENLSPAQKKGAQAELDGVKSQRELQQLEGRLMQQDNQALQRKIAQDNLVANKEMAHGQALDLAGRNKIVADTQKFGDAFTQAKMALKTIDASENGDDLATRMVPTMEVLGVNMMGGIKRIPPTEYDAAKAPISWINRWNQWISTRSEGKTSPEMVSEGKRLVHDLVDIRYGTYLNEAKSTALNFHLDQKGVYVMDNNGDSVPLSDATKSAPKGAKSTIGPTVGAIDSGFRFKGGNPADPNSWEPVKP